MLRTFVLGSLLLPAQVFSQAIFINQFEPLVAHRINDIALMDPHLFADGLGCTDYTGFLNDFWINSSFNNDVDGDGFLDLSIVMQFQTDQPNDLVSKNLVAHVVDGQCADPLFSEPCSINQVLQPDLPTTHQAVDACLAPIPGTTSGYSEPVVDTSAPCYVTSESDFSLTIQGLTIPFEAFQQAGRYSGGLLVDQMLLKGFISESSAMSVLIPANVPFVGGSTLYDLLPGGGSCSAGDDRDVGPDGITSGWWFYFNAEADLIELN